MNSEEREAVRYFAAVLGAIPAIGATIGVLIFGGYALAALLRALGWS